MAKLIDLVNSLLLKHTDAMTGFSEVVLLGFCDNYTASEHLARYIFTSKFVQGNVLDVACGSCYGSSVLRRSDAVDLVISVDIDRDLLIYGKGVYDANCVRADATRLPFKEQSFDSIVSVETLEHVKNQGEFINSIKYCLKEEGSLILSTPNKLYISPFLPKPSNPYHVNEYYLCTLLTLLKSHGFEVICVWGGRKISVLEQVRRIFGSLSKFLLSKFSLTPSQVDKLYHLTFARLNINGKSGALVDPDPKIFPHVKLKTTSNMIMYHYFVTRARRL